MNKWYSSQKATLKKNFRKNRKRRKRNQRRNKQNDKHYREETMLILRKIS